MFWAELINNFAVVFNTDVTTAGTLVSFIIIGSLLLSVYILTRGTVSNSKTWMTVSAVISIFLFTYPVGWMSLWALIAVIVFVCVYVAAKVSGREGD